LACLTYVTDISFIAQFLVGLSGLGVAIDYSLLLITRWREEVAHGHDAVITGIGRTGRLVTSAVVILFLAMAALASVPFTFLKIFATGAGAGILSTRPWSGRCWSLRSCRCSDGGTGGFRAGQPSCCG